MASSISINCQVNGNRFQYENYSQSLNENKPPRFFLEPVLSQNFLQFLQFVTIWDETIVTTKALSKMQNDRPLLIDISRRELYLVPWPYIHALRFEVVIHVNNACNCESLTFLFVRVRWQRRSFVETVVYRRCDKRESIHDRLGLVERSCNVSKLSRQKFVQSFCAFSS